MSVCACVSNSCVMIQPVLLLDLFVCTASMSQGIAIYHRTHHACMSGSRVSLMPPLPLPRGLLFRATNPVSRFFADMWYLFPEESEYLSWFTEAGYVDVKIERITPSWYVNVSLNCHANLALVVQLGVVPSLPFPSSQ